MSKNSKETLRHRRWRGWESGAVGREPVAWWREFFDPNEHPGGVK